MMTKNCFLKKGVWIILAAVMVFALASCAETSPDQVPGEQPKPEPSAPDQDWILPETIEMTDEITKLFVHATEGLTGVQYDPVGFLGEKDGAYCILCRACVVYPDAKPYYALVYVNEQGLQNIWDIWMGAHAENRK